MKSQRTLFVCEFITGGGLAGADLPESLVREGILMRDALLRDLSALDDWQITTTHDTRLQIPDVAVKSLEIQAEQDAWPIWRECVASADAVWVVAPESNGILQKFSALVVADKPLWIGVSHETIAIASNKYQMAQVLGDAKLPVIPTYFYDDWVPDVIGGWVVKPNDGAGCEATFMLSDIDAVKSWFDADLQRKNTHIIQPYLIGVPASISVLGLKDEAIVLSCNLQSIRLHHGQFSYIGGVINGACEYWAQLSELANQVKSVLPGLVGYFGMDVLLNTDSKGSVSIVEINPRLTTSYVYLHEAIGCNPAHLVMNAMLGRTVDVSTIKRNLVEFNVENKV
ncbi:MAG: ATP-grasp domain-containing protein [Methylophilus sp.]|nr:ATP-grasp domain-containing protein [Methylophilus sp.]